MLGITCNAQTAISLQNTGVVKANVNVVCLANHFIYITFITSVTLVIT